MIETKLLNETKYLFDRSYDAEMTVEEEDALTDRAEQLIADYGWQETFSAWSRYLYDNCKTAEAAINYANLFWWYGGQEYIVPNPYDFVGYFYYRVDLNPEKYDGVDILDSIATTVLPKAGCSDADLVLHPDYMPENDPKIVAAVEKYKGTEKR